MNSSQISNTQVAALFSAVLLLSACGGGNSDGAAPAPQPSPVTQPAPAPVPSPVPAPTPIPSAPTSVSASALQGRWLPPSSGSGFGLIVLPAINNSAQAWALAQDGSALAKLSINSETGLTVSGRSYSLNNAPQTVSTLSGSATAVVSINPKTLSFTGLAASKLDFIQSDALIAPALQADMAASWRASFNQGSQFVNWTITSSGIVSGNSNTGCAWSGSLLAISNATIYSASLTESCITGSTQLEGIATINAAKTQLTVVTTSTDHSKATLLLMAKSNP